MKNRNTRTWQDILMHDATGVDTADPMLVDYLLAKVDTPLREVLLRRYQGQQRPFKDYKERSRILGGLRAIRAVIVKDTISVSEAPNKRTEEWKGINEKIRQNAGLSWTEYQRMAEVVHTPTPH